MRLRVGTPRQVLVIAPHPDDEAIGAYGLIRAAKRRGARVRVVVVADGAASHPNSARWPVRRLVAERRRETRRAMRRLRVCAGEIAFLDLPDGGLPQVDASGAARLARAIRRARCDLLVSPVADDAHADHRAVAAIVARTATPGARRLHYLVWPDRTRARGPVEGLALGQTRLAKRQAIRVTGPR